MTITEPMAFMMLSLWDCVDALLALYEDRAGRAETEIERAHCAGALSVLRKVREKLGVQA